MSLHLLGLPSCTYKGRTESRTLRSVSSNYCPSYSRHSCSSQHNAKAIPMIIVNSKTRENKQLDASHQAEGHAKPGSFDQVQKGKSHHHPSSSSVQLPSRVLQYLAVDDARVCSFVLFFSPAVAVAPAVSGAAAGAAAVTTMAVATLAVAPFGVVAAATSGATVAAAAAVAATAVATLAVAAAVAATVVATLAVAAAVAAAPLGVVPAAASHLAVVAAAAAAAAAGRAAAAVNPPWRTAVSGLAKVHHLEHQGDEFSIPMRYRWLPTVAAQPPRVGVVPWAAASAAVPSAHHPPCRTPSSPPQPPSARSSTFACRQPQHSLLRGAAATVAGMAAAVSP